MSRKRRTILVVLAILLVSSCCVALPCSIFKIRDGEGWARSANNLMQIGLALQNYHSKFGRLPPAVLRSKDGRPLHSWRVLLLPDLEYDPIYKQVRLDEPWDSQHNAPLFAANIPPCYVAPWARDEDEGLTHYQVLVGPGTAFERPRMTWVDFSDGVENTIIVVETAEAVPWAKPVDLEYSPDSPLPPFGASSTKPVKLWCYEISRKTGFLACFADGQARFIPHSTPENVLRGLITRNGGEPVKGSAFN